MEWFEFVCRRDARTRGGRWAISRLRLALGEDWLAHAIERADESYPLALIYLGSHLLALAQALVWALRLELIMDLDGRGEALRDLQRDPGPRRLLHSQAQLLLAGPACRLDWPVALETAREGRPPADLEITAPTGLINAEIRVLTRSDDARRQHAAMNQTSDWLLSLRLEHSVWIGGKLHHHPAESQRQEIAQLVRDNASILHSGVTVELSMPGIELSLSPTGATNGSLHGPSTGEDLFRRMVGVIA